MNMLFYASHIYSILQSARECLAQLTLIILSRYMHNKLSIERSKLLSFPTILIWVCFVRSVDMNVGLVERERCVCVPPRGDGGGGMLT